MEHVVLLIALHAVTGNEIDINAAEITSMYETKEDDANDKLIVQGVRCVINMTDGKFASVREQCSEVRDEVKRRLDRAYRRLDQIIKEP
jgi:hypothetical protein